MPTATPPAVSSYLTDAALADLAHLAQHEQHLKQIATCASKLQPALGLPEAAGLIAQEMGLAVNDVNRILWTIWNLYQLETSLQTEAADLIDTLSKALETHAATRWKQGEWQSWSEGAPAVIEVLEGLHPEHPLVVSTKAQRLAYAHQNVFLDARIITDVRPVFDADGSKVLESFVIHTLLLEFFDGSGTRRAEFALDAAGAAHLRRLCERAEGKATVLKNALANVGWPNAVFGEDRGSEAHRREI